MLKRVLKETRKGNFNLYYISCRIHISLNVSIELSEYKSIDKVDMKIVILVLQSGFTGTLLSVPMMSSRLFLIRSAS